MPKHEEKVLELGDRTKNTAQEKGKAEEKTCNNEKAADKLWNFPNLPRPPPPYPLKPEKIKDENKEFINFVKMMKKVNMNISMFELFTNVPKFDKFLKEMIANKERYEEDSIVEVSATCSRIIKKDIYIPPKLKNPRSCTIRCELGGKKLFKALCDQGSGVSLMPGGRFEVLYIYIWTYIYQF